MISIIVPIYCVEKYLSQCIDSLICQSYRDIEIILVDDGSPDSCGDICDSYAKNDSRIVVIHQANAGVSAARNTGLLIARGQLIGFVDPDDWIAPNMYYCMQKAIEDCQVDLAICGYVYCNENGMMDEQRHYFRKDNELLTQKETMKRMSDIPPSIRHVVWNKLFKKKLLQGISFPEYLHASEDVSFLTEYILKIKSSIIIHEPYYYNRVREGSATHGGLSISSLCESYKAHEFMYQNIVNTYPELKDYSQAFLLDVCLLKYKEGKRRTEQLKDEKKKEALSKLRRMRKFIRKNGMRALLNPQIYWKTRIIYLGIH